MNNKRTYKMDNRGFVTIGSGERYYMSTLNRDGDEIYGALMLILDDGVAQQLTPIGWWRTTDRETAMLKAIELVEADHYGRTFGEY